MMLLLTIAAVLTAAISVVAGLGGGIVRRAMMSLLLPITAVIPVHGVVQLVSNSTRMLSLMGPVDKDIMIEEMLTQVPQKKQIAEGAVEIGAVLFDIGRDGKCKKVKRIREIV